MRYINGKPVIRCSSLNQLLSCNGSITIIDKIGPTAGDESDSWEGNYCHWKSAFRFVKDFGAMEPEGGLLPPRVPATWKPNEFSEWIVDYFIRAVMEDVADDWALEVEAEMLQEFSTFWLEGHLDVGAISPDMLSALIRDLKAGIIPVDIAELNWQLLGYAALYKLSYPTLRAISLGLVQPRMTEDIGRRQSEVVINTEGTFAYGDRIGDATIDNIVPFIDAQVSEALRNPRALNSGPKQCRWCPADLQCPACIADREAMKMTLTDEALAKVTANPSIEQLADWALSKKFLDPKFAKAWDLLKAQLAVNGEFVSESGAKFLLKDRLGNREFSQIDEAWETICGVLDPEMAYACLSLSFTELERQFAKQLNIPIDSKKGNSGKKELESRLGHLIRREPGKQLTIVV